MKNVISFLLVLFFSHSIIGMDGIMETSFSTMIIDENHIRSLLDQGRVSIVHHGVPLTDIMHLLSLAYVFPCWKESRELLKCVAAQEPFVLVIPGYNNISSLFHFIVVLVNHLKQKDPAFYRHFLTGGGLSLISWLADKGVKDEVLSEGKTAAQKAEELGMQELAQHLISVSKDR